MPIYVTYIMIREISSLAHKPRDDTVKDRTVESKTWFSSAKSSKVLEKS
jgi:hypothetical protein